MNLAAVDVGLALLASTLALTWAGLWLWLVRAASRGAADASTVAAVLTALADAADPARAVSAISALDQAMVLRVAGRLPDGDPRILRFASAVADAHGIDWLVATAGRTSGTPRLNWQRIAALRLLAALRHPDIVAILGEAARDADPEIVGAALALLGRLPDPTAADHLIGTLKSGRYAPSRVASYLDQFPVPVADRLLPLLHHPDATVRYWGVTLLSRHPGIEGLSDTLTALTADSAPLVRRAAVAALARVDPAHAAGPAQALLADPAWFVRVHAARAIAETGDPDLAEAVAPLLADREWWVRTAAKEALQRMGVEVWPVLVPYLDHQDPFARNGAAEVLQNIGILDSLIVLEAATMRPSPAKIEMLRKIASAGGTRMTEALLDRLDEHTRPRVLSLLASLGLEPAGVRG